MAIFARQLGGRCLFLLKKKFKATCDICGMLIYIYIYDDFFFTYTSY